MSKHHHVDTTRRSHLRELAKRPLTIALGGGAVVTGALLAGIAGGAIAAIAAAIGVAVVAAAVVWIVADARSEEDFFEAYAASRSLGSGGRASLPEFTALLRRGTRRYAERAFGGLIPGGRKGILAHYTYETLTISGKGARTDKDQLTVVVIDVPEAADFIRELEVERRVVGEIPFLTKRRQRVAVESAALSAKCEIFIGVGDDMNRARQLLSPTFVEWLAGSQGELTFELENGVLVRHAPFQIDNQSGLDWICTSACYIADRISAEALESAPHGTAQVPERFDPRSLLTPVEPKTNRRRLVTRLAGLAGLVAVAGVIIAGGISEESEDPPPPIDDLGPVSVEEALGIAADSPSAELDAELLPLMASLDEGKGVDQEDLYGEGLDRQEVNRWFAYASEQGLIELDMTLSYTITPAGEERLAELGG